MKFVFVLLLFFLVGIYFPSPALAVVYTGSYPHGLTVSENGAIVENADISNGGGADVCLKITGDNVTVKNSKIHDCKSHGVIFMGTNGGIIENSEIYRAAMKDPPNSVGGGWPSLLKVQSIDESTSGLAHHIIIRNNYIHEGYGECMGLRGSYITVTGNTVKDCYSIGIYSNSDHTTVEKNIVQCTGNPEFNRAGLPMVGIGFAEEGFPNWGAHGHDSQTILNNTVTGCKYGVRYGSSTHNMGLSNTEIAYNKFLNIKLAAISITHYASEQNVNIHDNTTGTGSIPTSSPALIKTADLNADGKIDIFVLK